jgi:DNA-binding GntR family transcriptional regulator
MTAVTRAETTADAIRVSILGGQILSGERLVELILAQSLGVSQNTVREALRILEAEGWVVKQARHGVYVRSFSPADAAEVCALIEAVELLVLAWALERIDKIARADLAALLAAAHKSADKGDLLAAFAHLIAFHERLGAAADRPITQRLLETLYNQVRLLEALRHARAPRTARELDAQTKAHEALARAIAANDAVAACDCLHQQIALYSAATVAALRLGST